jgi:hypothetical protein
MKKFESRDYGKFNRFSANFPIAKSGKTPIRDKKVIESSNNIEYVKDEKNNNYIRQNVVDDYVESCSSPSDVSNEKAEGSVGSERKVKENEAMGPPEELTKKSGVLSYFDRFFGTITG